MLTQPDSRDHIALLRPSRISLQTGVKACCCLANQLHLNPRSIEQILAITRRSRLARHLLPQGRVATLHHAPTPG